MAASPEEPVISTPTAADAAPAIHPIYCQSTGTWQYIIADPTTNHCIIIDPVRDRCADKAAMSTTAADAIITLVQERSYIVDYILETHAAGTQCLSAAWYLRMQFSQTQESPPQLCDEVTVSSLQAMMRRKYGADNKFSTTIRAGLVDGEKLELGQLSLTCMHMSGFGSPHRRAYLIDGNIFGIHSIASLEGGGSGNTGNSSDSSVDVDSEDYLEAWASVQRILSLPKDTRVWRETQDQASLPDDERYDLLAECALVREGGSSSESEFLARRREESVWAKPPSTKVGGLKARLGTWLAVQ